MLGGGGGGGGVFHPSQLTTGLVIKSVTTSPTLAGERMLFILQVSILSEQRGGVRHTFFFHRQARTSNTTLSLLRFSNQKPPE